MSNQADHTIVRLRVPPELKKQIEESAERNNRSQSAEMVARLEGSFTQSEDNEFNREFVLGLVDEYHKQISDLQRIVVQLSGRLSRDNINKH